VDTVAQAVEVEESQKQQQLAQQPATAGAPKEKGDKKKDKGKGKKPPKLAGIADLNKDNSGTLTVILLLLCGGSRLLGWLISKCATRVVT
jgi:hypothetical protein